MQQENRREITLCLKRLDERFSLLESQEERVILLGRMKDHFSQQIVTESERVKWMLSWSNFSLLPWSRLLYESDDFLDYPLILTLLDRYLHRKRHRGEKKEEEGRVGREKRMRRDGKLLIKKLLPEDDLFSTMGGGGEEWKNHFKEQFVDRANFKLTFTLKEFVLSARKISGGSFTWYRYEGGECWFEMTNGLIFIHDQTRFESITIFSSHSGGEVELDGKQWIGKDDCLNLSQFVKEGESVLIRARTDLRVVFPPGSRLSTLKIKSHSSCKFDLDQCHLEYFSHEWYPFPYQFFISDVDHLMNLERMVAGKSLKPLSPNSAKKLANLGGFHSNLQRLKALRRMKVDQSLSHPVPFFSIGTKPLSLIQEEENTLILYEDNLTLARCIIQPQKRLIRLDMIEALCTEEIVFDKIYRYPPRLPPTR